MEKSPVHRSAVECRYSSSKGIRQNRLAAKLARDRAKPRRNFVQRLIPRDAPPRLRVWVVLVWLLLVWERVGACPERSLGNPVMRSAAPLPRHRPLRTNPPHGV